MGKEATALLTLSQGLTRDKLVQGAGRLRQLGKGQTLVMAGTKDVLRGMKEPMEVLLWVLRNTAVETELGLAEWANQGFQFYSGEPFIDEDWTLEHLYSAAEVEEKLPDVARRRMTQDTEAIVLHCETHGQDVSVRRTGANEECEREQQLEEERMQEREREVIRICPRLEVAWDYSSVQTAMKVSDIIATEYMLLGAALPAVLGWERHAVYATINFLMTCTQGLTRRVHQAMRRAWGMLKFDNEVLLLSDMEANGLCKDVKFTRTVVCKHTLVELYNGETNAARYQDLKEFTNGRAKNILRKIVQVRGLWSNWSCSELERACDD